MVLPEQFDHSRSNQQQHALTKSFLAFLCCCDIQSILKMENRYHVCEGAEVRFDRRLSVWSLIPAQAHAWVWHDSYKPGATQKWVMRDPDRQRERESEAGAGSFKISIEKTVLAASYRVHRFLLEQHYKTCCSLQVVQIMMSGWPYKTTERTEQAIYLVMQLHAQYYILFLGQIKIFGMMKIEINDKNYIHLLPKCTKATQYTHKKRIWLDLTKKKKIIQFI